MLIAEKIYCIRNSRSLFNDINFSIAPGNILQIVGDNGVGKSSLLRIIAGLLQPESGQVSWHYQPIAQSDFYDHLFYLGHTLGIKSELTVAENISYSLLSDSIKTVLNTWSLDKVMH